jgi:formate dehydrogenase beta subunit
MPPRFSRQTDEKVISPQWAESQPRTSPCEAHCPAGNPIQTVSTLIAGNNLEQAMASLRFRNPFPGITGRVCNHPCEDRCNRASYDQAVAIQDLERFTADHADLTRVVKPRKKAPSGKTVAIIGSGPAGLTCAYFSALFGHKVTIFEGGPVLGGIPRLAIPGYRLPKAVVDKEVGFVLELGVQARINTLVGRDVGFQSILDSFDACVIAVGAWKERAIDLPDSDMAIPGITFLRRVNEGWRGPVGNKVVIAGGGGVAFDCAFTAKRLGAQEIHVVCVEDAGNMCASAADLKMARAQGIEVHNSRIMSMVKPEKGRSTTVEWAAISSFIFDERGSLSVECSPVEKETVTADTLISAIRAVSDFNFIEGDCRFRFSPRGTIEVDPESFATPVQKVFAAGDAVTGPSTVAGAIGSGRRTAVALDRYLRDCKSGSTERIKIEVTGEIVIEENPGPVSPHIVAYEEILNVESHEKKERQVASKDEVETGFEMDAASKEACRCFHCGHCTSCGCCVSDCPLYVLSMTPKGPEVTHFDECWHCGCCRIACPSGAVLYEFPLNMLV